jgi:hypothetical protein
MDIRELLRPFCPESWAYLGLIKEDGAWHVHEGVHEGIFDWVKPKLPEPISALLDSRVAHIHAEVEFIRVDFESSRVLWYSPCLFESGVAVVNWQLSEHETMLLLSSDPPNNLA